MRNDGQQTLVRLVRSGRQFSVQPGETVLAAGLRQGLALPFGCQSGSCGSCRVRLCAGQVRYPAGGAPALSEAELAAGYILMCLAQPEMALDIDLHQPEQLEQMRPRTLPARVTAHRALSHDVVGLWVKLPQPAAGGEPFRYLPGQYVDFLLADGRRRSFSIANADAAAGPRAADGAAGSTLEFHLRVTPGGWFAHYVQDDMPDKTLLRFEGPLGAFYLREDSKRPALLMAGGTGFAPIKAMLEGAFRGGASRPLHLFWGARSQRDTYQDSLAREWAATQKNFRYTPVLSEPDADWRGERGFVHEALLRAYPDLAGYEAYLAGPPAMVHAGKKAFTAAGLDADHLYYDSFDYAFETWPGMR